MGMMRARHSIALLEKVLEAAMSTGTPARARISVPRDRDNDYTKQAITSRQQFVAEQTGTELHHVKNYSFDPATLPGNIENFTGVAQVPIGVAGPLLIDTEDGPEEFYIPLATTEGTLISSYNRGMRLLSMAGGVTTTVVEDLMQRAPVFVFDSARDAHRFAEWVRENLSAIKEAAEETTRVGRLVAIDQFAVGPMLYLRFNYTTGDAAGQNMTGRATHAACEWIRAKYFRPCTYYLSGNIDTDKKHSQLNMLLTRGKRVVAEATIPSQLLQQYVHISSEDLARAREVQMVGAFIAGSASNAAHAANGLAALFIATGQDVANIAESHSAITYTKYLDNGDFYWSVTLPSLIIGTYGGGTALATQKECLQMLGCYGQGKARKFAQICAAVVLAGETSLVGAMLHGDWVSAHERLGRNR